MEKNVVQMTDQLQGLLCAPDLGTAAFPEGIEAFPTSSLYNSTKATLLPDIAPNTVFGKRMEQYLKYVIHASERFNIIADNIQIIENGRTIGELDFILHDLALNKMIHLELAVKFYVYDPEIPGALNRWIGPNRRDSLVRKMEKLKNHQFPLLYRPETINTLRNLNLPYLPISQALCFKTLLFAPAHEQTFSPDNLNPQAVSGTWMRLSEFQKLSQNTFYLPEKEDWICSPSLENNWKTHPETLEKIVELLERNRSPLCWMKSPDGSLKRFFVVWW